MKIALLLLLSFFLNHTAALASMPALWHESDPKWLWQNGVLWYRDRPFSGAVIRQQIGDSEFSFYVNGKLQGVQRRYYDNGQVQSWRVYQDGQKTGVHRGWWPNGQLKFEYHFINDQHDGPAYNWHQNGQLASVFHYQEGHESGLQQLWFENGQLRAQYQMVNGRRFGWMGSKICQ